VRSTVIAVGVALVVIGRRDLGSTLRQ